jgi:hypothetical protein
MEWLSLSPQEISNVGCKIHALSSLLARKLLPHKTILQTVLLRKLQKHLDQIADRSMQLNGVILLRWTSA